jgi:hypothetical protein
MMSSSLGCTDFWPWACVGVSEVREAGCDVVVVSWQVQAAATAWLVGERTSDDAVADLKGP